MRAGGKMGEDFPITMSWSDLAGISMGPHVKKT